MCRTFPFLVLFLALTLISSAQEEAPERDLREELFLAIEMNDPVEVRRALVEGAASEADFGDPSPLGTAAALNNATIVEMLLRVGANPARTSDNPLKAAVGNDNLEVVRLLLAAGAPVPGPGTTEEELFESALRGNNAVELAKELLEAGASADAGLRLAIERGNADAAELFLERGADVSHLPPEANLLAVLDRARARDWITRAVRDENRETALRYLLTSAIDLGDRELVALVVDAGAVVTYEDLKRSAEGDQEAMTRFLLRRMPDSLPSLLYQAEVEDATKLAETLREVRREALVSRFLPAGLAVAGLAFVVTLGLFARGSFARSPRRLHEAVRNGDLSRLEKLLEGGADPNCERDGVLPLQYAVMNDEIKAARTLVRHGASVNRRSPDDLGYAPLHIAASLGNIAMAEMLLRNGAAADVRDASGRTPLLVAAIAGHDEMMSLLIERGADVNATVGEGESLLMAVVSSRDVETAKRLLAVGADPAGSESGRTALHVAAQFGDAELVGLLLERGADPNAVEPSGATPLEVALRQNHEEVAARLRRGGARDHIRTVRAGGLRSVQEPSPAPTFVLPPPGPAKPDGES